MSQYNILFVEDDAELQHLVKTALERKSYRVTVCSNPIIALEALKTFTPDLIISDVMMPEMDGVSFFKKVIKMRQFKPVPFLFMTASFSEEMADEVLKLGAIDFLPKPYNLSALGAKIESLLRLAQQSQMSAFLDRGELEDFPLFNILQSCEENTFTGTLRVQRVDEEGVFYIERGAVINAQFGDYSQEDSLDLLLQWTDGSFVLEQKKFRVSGGGEAAIKGASENTPKVTDSGSAKENSPQDYYELFEEGLQAFYSNDYAVAINFWEKALKLKPADVRVTQNLTLVRRKIST